MLIYKLIGSILIISLAECSAQNNNNLIHGQFVGFGQFNPNPPNVPVGVGPTHAKPGGSVIFHPSQRPPTLNNNDRNPTNNNDMSSNGLISGRFPGFQMNTDQTNAGRFPTSSPTTTENPAAPSRAYLNCMANCLSTNEYNPVCGDDNVTYTNQWRLSCANRCGRNVAMVRMGTCQPS